MKEPISINRARKKRVKDDKDSMRHILKMLKTADTSGFNTTLDVAMGAVEVASMLDKTEVLNQTKTHLRSAATFISDNRVPILLGLLGGLVTGALAKSVLNQYPVDYLDIIDIGG
jgi:hypothetical protein